MAIVQSVYGEDTVSSFDQVGVGIYRQFVLRKVEQYKFILECHRNILNKEEIDLLESYILRASSGDLEGALDLLIIKENEEILSLISVKCQNRTWEKQ